MLFDAHNHLQDDRLQPFLPDIWRTLDQLPVGKMVVNGSCEEDWPAVLQLAKSDARIMPAFGYHPWHIKERSTEWQKNLTSYLEKTHSSVGEIGLDRWIKDYDIEAQTEVFVWQLRLAAERNLPVSIHCLQAWGLLLETLKREPRPKCGFLLHSFGGPKEMIPDLARLGGYFSFPGYFAQERKARQRETFRHVPVDRLLIETDAPDQLPPAELNRFPLKTEKAELNHPANLVAIYEYVASLLQTDLASLTRQVGKNFQALFGG